MNQAYPGIDQDERNGITDTGRIIRDAWLFGLIPETETCKGWMPGQIERLWERVQAEWAKYDYRVTALPEALRLRHEQLHRQALERALAAGWDPQQALAEDD